MIEMHLPWWFLLSLNFLAITETILKAHFSAMKLPGWFNFCTFLAVQNSSIGDIVTHSQYFYFWHTKSNPRDLWPLRHLIRVSKWWGNMTWPTFWQLVTILTFLTVFFYIFFLKILKIFNNFDNFRQFWQLSTIFKNVDNFWQFLQLLTIFDNIDNFWQYWQFLTILTI